MSNWLSFAMLAGIAFMSCQQPEKPAETAAATPESMPAFAYTINHPADNWSPGKLEHVATALKALKAYETGDIETCVAQFADSVKVEFDGFEASMSRDSLKAFFTNSRARSTSMEIIMEDWESVVSKDGKSEIVSLWYKEKWTDTKGVTDSMEMMDDLHIKDGKITSLNEKVRRFMKK